MRRLTEVNLDDESGIIGKDGNGDLEKIELGFKDWDGMYALLYYWNKSWWNWGFLIKEISTCNCFVLFLV